MRTNTIKYHLTSGEIVDAQRECHCSVEIHPYDEPHWLYKDRMWHERNRGLLLPEDADAVARFLAYMAFYKEESARLLWKESEMRMRGIAMIIYQEGEVADEGEDS